MYRSVFFLIKPLLLFVKTYKYVCSVFLSSWLGILFLFFNTTVVFVFRRRREMLVIYIVKKYERMHPKLVSLVIDR